MAELSARLERGALSFSAGRSCRIELRGLKPRVRLRYAGGDVLWSVGALAGSEGAYAATHPELPLAVDLECRQQGEAWTLRLALENRGREAVRVDELAPLDLARSGEVEIGCGSDRLVAFRNGHQSWSGTRAYGLDEADVDPRWGFLRTLHTDVRHRAAGRPGTLRSDLFTAIANRRSGEVLCLGFVTGAAAFSGITLRHDAKRVHELTAACDLDGVELPPGARLESETLWIAVGWDANALLERWAERLGVEMSARVEERSPSGWCSWYEDFGKVDEARVLRNLAAARELSDPLSLDFLLIDDGWQRAIGGWESWNRKFGRGMPWLAEQIRAADFYPGLWLAPFLARPDSELFRMHPDWFVRAADGKPLAAVWNPSWGWRGAACVLDTTKPVVQEKLSELARVLVHEWGYPVLKLDFLFAAALPGDRSDRRATRAQALRRGLEAIRAGAGEETFLLGCGCPLGPAVGLVDAMRVGPDVAPYWRNWLSRGPLRGRHGVAAENAVRNTLMRAFLHRRLWLNDPDCVLVRPSTRLTLDEVRTIATVAALTDGLLVVGDSLDRLPAERREILERAQELRGGRATVLDLLDRGLPELLLCEQEGRRRLAVFNFEDRPRAKVVDVGRLGVGDGPVTELWTARRYEVRSAWLDLGELPPHGCRVLTLCEGPRGGSEG